MLYQITSSYQLSFITACLKCGVGRDRTGDTRIFRVQVLATTDFRKVQNNNWSQNPVLEYS